MAEDPKPKKLMRALLVGSLALNVSLIGLGLGSVMSGRDGPPRRFDVQLGPMADALPREDRREIGRALRRALGENRPARGERGAALAGVLALLEADPFDGATFQEAIRAQQSTQDRVRGVALQVFVDHVAQMPAAERTALAARLRDQTERRKPRN